MDNWLVAFQKVLLAAESPYATVKRSSSIHRRKETISSHLYLVCQQMKSGNILNLG